MSSKNFLLHSIQPNYIILLTAVLKFLISVYLLLQTKTSESKKPKMEDKLASYRGRGGSRIFCCGSLVKFVDRGDLFSPCRFGGKSWLLKETITPFVLLSVIILLCLYMKNNVHGDNYVSCNYYQSTYRPCPSILKRCIATTADNTVNSQYATWLK